MVNNFSGAEVVVCVLPFAKAEAVAVFEAVIFVVGFGRISLFRILFFSFGFWCWLRFWYSFLFW